MSYRTCKGCGFVFFSETGCDKCLPCMGEDDYADSSEVKWHLNRIEEDVRRALAGMEGMTYEELKRKLVEK